MMTQNEMILDHLRTYGSITPISALEHYGCMRLSAREERRSYRRLVHSFKECDKTISEMKDILSQMAEERRKIERICTMPINMTEVTNDETYNG